MFNEQKLLFEHIKTEYINVYDEFLYNEKIPGVINKSIKEIYN